MPSGCVWTDGPDLVWCLFMLQMITQMGLRWSTQSHYKNCIAVSPCFILSAAMVTSSHSLVSGGSNEPAYLHLGVALQASTGSSPFTLPSYIHLSWDSNAAVNHIQVRLFTFGNTLRPFPKNLFSICLSVALHCCKLLFIQFQFQLRIEGQMNPH